MLKMATGGDDIDTTGGDVIIADLFSVPFSRRPFNEKMDIVKKGHPTPEHLKLNQPAKGYVRHFQACNWERYAWLAGSVSGTDFFFCWFLHLVELVAFCFHTLVK